MNNRSVYKKNTLKMEIKHLQLKGGIRPSERNSSVFRGMFLKPEKEIGAILPHAGVHSEKKGKKNVPLLVPLAVPL